MKVNIVMLTHNREALLTQAVGSLYEHTDRALFNLTLVDDSSQRSPLDYIHELHEGNATTLRIENSKGITGQARNLGIYWAERYWGRGDWLYLTDNDVYFTPGWLDKIILGLRVGETRGTFRVMGGWNHPFLKPNSYHPVSTDGLLDFTVTSHDAITGASQLMRWATWDQYGPLDAHAVGTGQSEDWKFCQDIIKDGGWVGCIQPHVVINCGLTNTEGKPIPGHDEVAAELAEWRKQYPHLIAE